MGRVVAAGKEAIVPTLAVAAGFLLWEAVVRIFRLPSYILPAPSEIWVEMVATGPQLIWTHTAATLKTTLLGFGLSVIVSFPLAIAVTSSATIANAIYPLLVLTQSVPKVAFAPILIIAFGATELPRVIVTFLVAFFPLVIATATGLQSTPPELVELGKSLRASR